MLNRLNIPMPIAQVCYGFSPWSDDEAVNICVLFYANKFIFVLAPEKIMRSLFSFGVPDLLLLYPLEF